MVKSIVVPGKKITAFILTYNCAHMLEKAWRKIPKDYVIATGRQYTVKEFVNLVCKNLNMKIIWKGKKKNEKAYWKNKPIIEIDNKYFRPTEVNSLKGDFSLAKKELGWMPKIHIKTLIQEMVNDELKFLTDDK